MKTVILAASPGTALFPLANCHPQLAFPIANRTLLAHQLDVLRRAQVTHVALVANGHVGRYRRIVQDLRKSERLDMDVRFHSERVPAGTAGSLRAIESFAGGEDFVLIAGGVHLAALDLTALVEAHRARGAALTVVTEPDASVPYIEHVDVDACQTVRAFHVMHHSRDRRRQPPSVPRVPERRSPCIAAGVYVVSPAALAHVRREGHMDLKEQLVPALRAAGLDVYAYHRPGATRHVSGLAQYLELNAELLQSGRAWARVAGAERQLGAGVWVGANVHVSPSARLRGPVLIGANTVVGPGVTIVGPVAIGAGCAIDADASIERCVIWPGSRIGRGARIRQSVVAEKCDIAADGIASQALVVTRTGSLARLSRLAGTDAAHDGFGIMVAAERLVPIERASVRHRISTVSKRALDIGLSLGALVTLAPVFALIGLAIRADSRGPVLYSQRRCGLNGREFRMWKFRTMVPDAERLQQELFALKDVDGPMFKLDVDPRVTRIGRILRKTSLDELPQLVNVLRGEMSMVGPRPLVMEEMKFAPGWRDLRLRVRPGISGLWQVNGRSNVSFHDWIHHDIDYVTRRSFRLDLKILKRTLRALRIGEGAK